LPKKRWVLGAGLLALVAAISITAVAIGQSSAQPADKAFAAASKDKKFSATDGNQVLLTATVKNSKPTDMILQVSMECSIITDAVITGTQGATESTTTQGKVRTWITIDNDSNIVPIISSSDPPQDPSAQPKGDDSDKVTFCNRVFNRTAKDQETPSNGLDYSRDYIETKDANAFNWLRLNMGSGTHVIKLWGELTADPEGDCAFTAMATPGSSCAHAYVGSRSMIGEPTKLANNAVVGDPATG